MTNQPATWIFFFGDPLPRPPLEMKDSLGGKGASLAAMTQAGLPVPPGFTISAECCRHVLEQDGRWPEGLEREVRENLARLETATGRRFGRGRTPLLVSVRSGAAASMPGMMDTILNCGLHPGLAEDLGDTPRFWRVYVQFILAFARTVAHLDPSALRAAGKSEEAPSRDLALRLLEACEEEAGRPFPTEPWDLLAECINAVFRSWNSDRAIAYRRRNNLRGLRGTAVTVQAMFPSQVSGILFTRDPNRPSSDEMIIEASYGLGEAVVSGDVTPDRFVVRRDDPAAVRTFLGHKTRAVLALEDDGARDAAAAALAPAQVGDLARLALRVESHFGIPMDIEWGLADGAFALLQCRPIRGLEIAEDVDVGREEEILRLRQLAGPRRRVWVAHNLGETLRAPTPLTWDILRQFMSGAGGFGQMYRDFGYRPSDDVCRAGFLELICGRIYADPQRQARLFWDGLPMAYDLEAVLRAPRLLDRAPTRFDPDAVDGRFLLRLPGTLVAMWRGSRLLGRARREAKAAFEEAALPPLLDYVGEKRDQDLSALATPALVDELQERRRRVLDDFGKESLKPGFFGGVAFDAVEQILAQLMGKEAGARLASDLTSGLEGDVTFDQDALLYRVAAGEVRMEDFLDRFGHRAIGEMELAEPRWREDPSYLEALARQLRCDGGRRPEEIHAANVARRRAAEARLPDALAEWGGSALREPIEADLADARNLLPYRERGKHFLMMGYDLVRRVLVELGQRWDLGSDLFFLRLEELPRFEAERGRLVEEIARRRIRWQSAQRLSPADVIDSERLARLGLAEETVTGADLEGEAVAAGVAAGPARIVFDPRQAGDLGSGYILVCPSTDPGWTPLFLRARGLVVERGGVLSHGAIVARDFGIPAVVCPGATGRIRPGARIQVDGNRGRITVLAE